MTTRLRRSFRLLSPFLMLTISSQASAFPRKEYCTGLTVATVTTEPLETPVLPDLRPSRREIDPEPSPSPRRKSAPRPMPDRPLLPTVDPKDIIPLDLYHADKVSSQALRRMPADLLDHLEAAKDREMTALKSELFPNRTVSLAALAQKTQQLLSEIEIIEGNHREALNNIIKEMVEDNYGSEVKQQLKIQITKEFPARQESSEGDQLKDSPMLTAQVFRREVYNSLSQAAGWSGMVQFYKSHADQINAISPGLADKYETLHKLFRLSSHEMLSMLPSLDFLNSIPRSQLSHGREIVNATPEEFVDESGEKRVAVKVTGVAVGANAWATAHEANKAGFEMATALESVSRMPLTPAERDFVNDRSNSSVAEIRQGIYGVAMDKILRRSLAFLLNQNTTTGMANTDYLTCVERIFSQIPTATFEKLVVGLLSEKIFTDVAMQRETSAILGEFGIFADLK
jgi:hypothetical protein